VPAQVTRWLASLYALQSSEHC